MGEQLKQSLRFSSQAMMAEAVAAAYLGMSRIWLRQSRMKGTGPAFVKIGRSVRYAVSDLDAFIAARRVQRDRY